jgi:SAM-dependent methyltransferase
VDDRLAQARAEAEAARNLPVAYTPRRRAWVARFVEPLAQAQRAFNSAALRTIDALSERIDRTAGVAAAAERRSRELEERLLRLERRSQDGPNTVAAQPRQDSFADYFAFEARLRGPTEEVRERQRPYVELLRDQGPVLDIGCGRGELLTLLRDAGIEARGVDADADMVAYASGEGVEVEQADALAHIGGLENATLGAVVALQLVEHLPPAALVALFEQAARVLRPGGLLLLETINPVSPAALRNYFADLTHAQPLVAETLELLVREADFGTIEIRYLNPPEAEFREIELPAGEEFDAARSALAANRRLLGELLMAPLDYAVTARR